MNVPFFDLKRMHDNGWLTAARRVVESGRYINGRELSEFESVFAAYCGASSCLGVANGTDAIEIALRAAGVSAGDEVATVANAGMYSSVAIRAVGAIPVFVDVDDLTLLMSPKSLAAAISPKTRALVVTHLYGAMAPMREIISLADRQGLVVIEDCAQAHGAIQEGRLAGTWGLAGCFSFYPTKNLGAIGDAGAIITSDPEMARRIGALRQYGWENRFHSTVPGGRNSRMDEIQAAVLTSKLPFLDLWNNQRKAIASRYARDIAGCRSFRTLGEVPGSVFHLYVIRCRDRDHVQGRLAKLGIHTEVHYPVLDPQQPSQANLSWRAGPIPVSERAVREVLSLPCYPGLSSEELDLTVQSLIATDELH